ncbi:MAG: hypothetical protein ABI743_03430 [bacterium]
MRFKMDELKELSVMKALGFMLTIPFLLLIFWYALGVGIVVAGKLIGMRNASGVNNVVCGTAFPFVLFPFLYYTLAKAQIFGATWGWVLFGLLMIIEVIWTLMLLREFFRVGWIPTIIGLLIGIIVGALIFAAAFAILVMIFGLIKTYIPY